MLGALRRPLPTNIPGHRRPICPNALIGACRSSRYLLTFVTATWCARALQGSGGPRHARDMTESNAPQGGIVLTNLSKSYGPVHAVRSIDLRIAPGETVALLGPNGAGKTTTIDMVLGLTRPDTGSISLFGMTPSQAVAAGALGGMLQTGSPLALLKVRELVSLMGSYYPHPLGVDEVLRVTGADQIADRRTNKLSGGQAQRLRFAAALIGDPDLLLLDEPTAGIDVEGRREFWQTMRQIAGQGKTVVFATHYLEEADAFADRIVLISRGRIVADGPATEIKSRAAARTIRATLPGADVTRLGSLPGVLAADRHGDTIILSCSDTDEALRALVGAFPEMRDVEVGGGTLEEAFLELTGGDGDEEDLEASR
jgi:ABC-2 type transport system ATP-binding protein